MIGAASSRLALSLLLRRRNVSSRDALRLLDDASAAIQYSRELLQHALDHARQGITVLDRDLRLLAWNRAFIDLYELPPEFVRIGVGLDEIIRLNAERGSYGPGAVEEVAAQRIHSFVHDAEPQRVRLQPTGRVIEVRTNKLPGGGFVTTYTDATETVAAEEARKRANELLEQRVRERTEELTRLNAALTHAKAEADEANISKTRFLAAASHDILQPLNAARLYATSLVERDRDAGDSRSRRERRRLARRGRGDPHRAARPVAPRHRRHEAAMDELPHRRDVPPAAARVRPDRRREPASPSPSSRRRSPSAPTGASCAGCCRT